MSIKEIKKIEGTWVFLGGVSGVELTKSINNECKILNVTLVASQSFNRRRKKFGLERKTDDLFANKSAFFRSFLNDYKVFATFRRRGVLNEIESQAVDLAREELQILAASQLGYSSRKHKAKPKLVSSPRHGMESLLYVNEKEKSCLMPNKLYGRFGILILDERWKKFSQDVFYANLLRILQGKVRVANSWRKDLRNALILIGQSQTTMDLPRAFLWNIITLEVLLTCRDDKVVEQLPRRVEAFLNWATGWDSIKFRSQIKKLYEKRNAFVHQGKRSGIGPEDVLFLDELLLNVLVNIGSNPKTFSSKEKLIEFSKKVEAEAVLGIKKSKVRPKNLRHIQKLHNPVDFEW